MSVGQQWEERARSDGFLITYQLIINLAQAQRIAIGRLGKFQFPAGRYLYTGSAKRNLISRVKRHLSKNKKLRWHIDYLLTNKAAMITDVMLSAEPECCCNQNVTGDVIAQGFGASDCRAQCGSHLKYLGQKL